MSAPIDGALNVMEPPWFDPATYRSDSNQHWRSGCPHEELRTGAFPWLQLLTHPEIWVYPGSRMGETMRAMLEEEKERRLDQLAADRIDLRDRGGSCYGGDARGRGREDRRDIVVAATRYDGPWARIRRLCMRCSATSSWSGSRARRAFSGSTSSGREILSFVEGEPGARAGPGRGRRRLATWARLLRRMHDAQAGFERPAGRRVAAGRRATRRAGEVDLSQRPLLDERVFATGSPPR